jgi:hypothetical protein
MYKFMEDVMQSLIVGNKIVLLASVLLICSSQFSFAKQPVRSDGGVCTSTGSTRTEGTTPGGKREFCTWDTCTYNKCDNADGTGHCRPITELSNPTGCVVGKRPLKGKIPNVGGGKVLNAQ